MKRKLISLLVILGLVGCTTMDNYSQNSKKYRDETPLQADHKYKNQDYLSSNIEEALIKLVGHDDFNVIQIINNKTGEVMTFKRNANIRERRIKLKDVNKMLYLSTSSFIGAPGSTCTYWVRGHVAGGAWIDGYCDD